MSRTMSPTHQSEEHNERLDDKLDRLSEKVDRYHIETMAKIYEVSKVVSAHERMIEFMKWLFPSGCVAGLLFLFKDYFIK
jgi:hypothetical protein